MSTDVNVLLKYNRMQPSWICPHCETENSYNTERCMLCGGVRDIYAIHAQEGIIQDMYPSYTQNYSAASNSAYPTDTSYSSVPKKSDNTGAILAIGIGVAVFIFIIIVAIASGA